jgi:hypothetical protein
MIMTLLGKNGLTKALTRMTKKENDRAKPFVIGRGGLAAP